MNKYNTNMRKGSISKADVGDTLRGMINGLLGVGKLKNTSPAAVAAQLINQGMGGKKGMLDIPRFATQEKARSILNNIKDRDRRGSASDASSAGPREQAMRLMRAISLGGKAPIIRDPENPKFESTPRRKVDTRTPMRAVDYGARGGPRDPENPYYEANPRNVPSRETGNRSAMKRLSKSSSYSGNFNSGMNSGMGYSNPSSFNGGSNMNNVNTMKRLNKGMKFSKNETWKNWLDELMKIISQTSGGLVNRAFPGKKTTVYPNASMFDSRLADSYYRPSGSARNPLAAAYNKSPMAKVPPKFQPSDLAAEIQNAADIYLSNLTRIKDLDNYLSNTGVGQVTQSAWDSVFGKTPDWTEQARRTKPSTPKQPKPDKELEPKPDKELEPKPDKELYRMSWQDALKAIARKQIPENITQPYWESVFGQNPVTAVTARRMKSSTPRVNTAAAKENTLMGHLRNPDYYRGETKSSYGPLFDNFPLANTASPTSTSTKKPRSVPQSTGMKVIKEPWEKAYYSGILMDRQNKRINDDNWNMERFLNDFRNPK